MTNNVVFRFSGKASKLKVRFECTDTLLKKDNGKEIKIPADKIRIVNDTGRVQISVDVSRNGHKDVAAWYRGFVGDQSRHMTHTAHGSSVPGALNFALRGNLFIGDHQYAICFGQGSYLFTNNWHLCSPALEARQNKKAAYLGNAYYVSGSSTHEFTFSESEELAIGKGIKLWAYTDAENIVPTFDLEGDALHPFPYLPGNLAKVGSMQSGKAYDTEGVLPQHRDFHLQAVPKNAPGSTEVVYTIDRVLGSIKGPGVFEQTAIDYAYDGVDYVMNYGMTHAAQPVENQAYVYTGRAHRRWMADLADELPCVRIRDLVLPGAHDAGMYEANIENLDQTIAAFRSTDAKIDKLFGVAEALNKSIGVHALANFAATQKDNAYRQMEFGTRYFDFRPAYDKNQDLDKTYHVHNFIPGVLFSTFLKDVSRFLQQNKGELAFIEITASGIDETYFNPLTPWEIEYMLRQHIPMDVGYTLTKNIKGYHDQAVGDLARSGQRVIVIHDKDGIPDLNSSWNSEDYSASLADPSHVINALQATLEDTGDHQYTVLSLQNTGSSAFVAHYIADVLSHPTAWANDLLFSATGNILQATKPAFDHATYQWLAQQGTIDALCRQRCPVMIQNDFVDVALGSLAVALSTSRYRARTGPLDVPGEVVIGECHVLGPRVYKSVGGINPFSCDCNNIRHLKSGPFEQIANILAYPSDVGTSDANAFDKLYVEIQNSTNQDRRLAIGDGNHTFHHDLPKGQLTKVAIFNRYPTMTIEVDTSTGGSAAYSTADRQVVTFREQYEDQEKIANPTGNQLASATLLVHPRCNGKTLTADYAQVIDRSFWWFQVGYEGPRQPAKVCRIDVSIKDLEVFKIWDEESGGRHELHLYARTTVSLVLR